MRRRQYKQKASLDIVDIAGRERGRRQRVMKVFTNTWENNFRGCRAFHLGRLDPNGSESGYHEIENTKR